VSRQPAAVTPWETRVGVEVECLHCDYSALRRSGSDAISVAREHAEGTGHQLNIAKVLNCTVSGSALRLVAPIEEPNPYVQRTWAPERLGGS
jgi:hypothetical protein